ncbi:SH3 domain-containing protein [Aeromicrobium phragmitis]|uniref:SH3 domain-containing protein n=1 Tax=Aeromicrobium phragmitis TaxID=2478914 RepID=UPI001FB5F463|nr:SH3 domain-containing protein [Aeromicrobium phragmitis]
MSTPGHRKVTSRRRFDARRLTRTAATPAVGITAVAAAALATLGGAVPAQPAADAASQRTDVISASLLGARTEPPVSRSEGRPSLPGAGEAKHVGVMFLLEDVEVRSAAADDAPVLASLGKGSQVAVTDVEENGFRQIVHNDLPRWVPAELLSATEPKPEPPPEPEPEPEPENVGLSGAPCPTGSSVESGLLPDTIAVHRAVCAAFPEVSTYGGLAGRNEHATGQALDIMVSGATGWRIAEFLQAHQAELGVEYLIYEQKIWSVDRASEGWRPMSDRGGATANHYDHVHVTTYGSAATQ